MNKKFVKNVLTFLIKRSIGVCFFFWLGLDIFHNPFAPISICLTFLVFVCVGAYFIKDNLQGAVDVTNSVLGDNVHVSIAESDQLNNFQTMVCNALPLLLAQVIYSRFLYPDLQTEISITCLVIFVLSACSDFAIDKILVSNK
jgi:hypothetical protein